MVHSIVGINCVGINASGSGLLYMGAEVHRRQQG